MQSVRVMSGIYIQRNDSYHLLFDMQTQESALELPHVIPCEVDQVAWVAKQTHGRALIKSVPYSFFKEYTLNKQ